VVVVAGQQHDLALLAEPLRGVAQEALGDRRRVAVRGLAQLEEVAQQHEPPTRLQVLEQRGAHVRALGERLLAARAEMQVGHDEGAHAGPP
jgi:hypothetical protein